MIEYPEAKEHHMGWDKITREDLYEGSDSPFITITNTHFRFNALFVRHAAIDPSYRVTIFQDAQNRKLAFEFHKENRPDSFTLTRRKEYGGLVFSNRGVLGWRLSQNC